MLNLNKIFASNVLYISGMVPKILTQGLEVCLLQLLNLINFFVQQTLIKKSVFVANADFCSKVTVFLNIHCVHI